MTPLGWFFIALMALFCAVCLSIAWHASPPVDLRGLLREFLHPAHVRRHSLPVSEVAEPTTHRMPSRPENEAATGGTPGDGGNPGAAHPRTDAAAPGASRTEITTPLLAAREHADAMWQASEEFLPPPADDRYDWMAATPQGQPYAPTSARVDLPAQPVRFEGEHPPWTGSQPALTSEMEARTAAAELDRRHYLRSHLPGYASMTDDDVRADMRRVYAGRHALPAAPVEVMLP